MTNDDGKGVVEALSTALLFPANTFSFKTSKPLFQHESVKWKCRNVLSKITSGAVWNIWWQWVTNKQAAGCVYLAMGAKCFIGFHSAVFRLLSLQHRATDCCVIKAALQSSRQLYGPWEQILWLQQIFTMMEWEVIVIIVQWKKTIFVKEKNNNNNRL